MKLSKIFALLVVTTLLQGCESTGLGGFGSGGTSSIKKEHIGTVAGAATGAWLGSNVGKGKGNIVAIAGGTLLGAYLGNKLGSSLDQADMARYNQTSQAALESSKTGSTATWSNPDSGNSGSITPTRTYQANSGQYCREYSQTINVGGRSEQAYGTACRQSDGSWKIIQ